VKKNASPDWRRYENLISFVVLVVLLVYTYGLLFVAPYPGFYFNPSDGQVLVIYQSEPFSPGLAIGDIIERVNQTPFDAYRENKNLNLFQGIQKGQTVEIGVRRDGESLVIPWVYPGFNRAGFFSRFFNVWWLAYIFLAIGMAAQLLMRPRNIQRRLFVASIHLMALFLMFGSLSSYHVMMSSILLRISAWLLLPVYIHFHWIFPESFRRIPRWLKIVFYVLFGAIALGELFQMVPSTLYFLAVSLAFGGSIVLLLFHYLLQPAQRREIRFLGFGASLALFPVFLLGIIGSGGRIPQSGPLALLALPILPGAYFYVLYRRSLGGLELRTNRSISLYIFLVLLGVVLLLAVGSTGLVDISREVFIFATVITALLTTFTGILLFPAFQAFVERRLLGIKLPAKNMVENFSARIVTSTTLPDLVSLLEEDVFPSLLIRQYAVVQLAESPAKILLAQDVNRDRVREEAIQDFIASAPTGGLIPFSRSDHPLGWARLILPLRIGPDLIGAWLLGRRDPDDHYPQAELPILGSLANQTAVALSNIIQTERLKSMYEANIHRYEEERLRLAHELHDSLLNEMAAMLMRHDPDALPREFQESYDGLIVRLREIVRDLRPPMLIYGLKYALDGLADNLSERNQDSVQIRSEVQATDECRFPDIVEHNIYRIVQEACENSLKYAQARSILITGKLSPGRIDLLVTDDGIGFNDGNDLRLEDMIANQHFGLAGIHERANLIGAAIKFTSQHNMGTQIQVLWESKDSI
jgi:signal transduction histidine kinase